MCRQTAMIPTHPMTDDEHGGDALLSDESTIELVLKARDGNRGAVQALLQRCLPEVRRWAHGRLPAHARDALDTGDLVQEAALRLLKRVDEFEPRHVGAMQAYLKQSIINRIRDEIRRVGRHPAPGELVDDPPGNAPSPLEMTIQHESYRNALARLSTRDRELVVARMEAQWSFAQIAERFGIPTADAARMAVNRALKKLSGEFAEDAAPA
jgi:RNA polymerase sigma factor (sigma-70 family)